MANKKLGYIPLYRSIQDHWIWSNKEPFSYGQAWIDLLLSVNHNEKKLKIGCNLITIKPGQMWTSYVKLANRWNWSRERVYRYTKLLKMDGMINVDATPNGTLLTIVNWDNFACFGNTHETANETTGETSHETANETTGETQTIMINNTNNTNNAENKGTIAPPSGGGVWQ
jgi:DNA replication protein DnaD